MWARSGFACAGVAARDAAQTAASKRARDRRIRPMNALRLPQLARSTHRGVFKSPNRSDCAGYDGDRSAAADRNGAGFERARDRNQRDAERGQREVAWCHVDVALEEVERE